jgi:Protein of unknown function (DUF2726)
MVIFLAVLVGVVVIAVFVWNYRRQAAAREAASAERMKAFLEQARATAKMNPNSVSTGYATSPTATPAAAPVPAVKAPLPVSGVSGVNGYAVRTSLLTREQAVLYQLMKMGLPDYHVFACVNLGAFIQSTEALSGFAREAQARRLADAMVDFLVCDKSLKAVVAVQCGAPSGKAAETAAFAASCVASTGVRWVEVSPAALPRRETIREVILG